MASRVKASEPVPLGKIKLVCNSLWLKDSSKRQQNHFELAGIDDGVTRKSPLQKVGIVIGQIKPIQRNDVGAGVVKFQPAGVLTRAVGDASQVIGLQFVNPKRREWRQRSATLLSLPGVAENGVNAQLPTRQLS